MSQSPRRPWLPDTTVNWQTDSRTWRGSDRGGGQKWAAPTHHAHHQPLLPKPCGYDSRDLVKFSHSAQFAFEVRDLNPQTSPGIPINV